MKNPFKKHNEEPSGVETPYGFSGLVVNATGWVGPEIVGQKRIDEITEGPRNTYLLFAGDDYDAVGGVGDYAGSHDTIGEAMAAFDSNRHDWAHIATYRGGTFTIVLEWYEQYNSETKMIEYGWRRPR